ncbi:MAG: hypothetical protein Q7J55_04180 [bacterium]|nr:hypothetical protein [bacterium]
MQEEKPDIGCETFLQREPRIKFLTDRINLAETIDEKAQFAEELASEAKSLLDCGDYNEERLDCINCQTVSSLREKMATLILKTSVIFG